MFTAEDISCVKYLGRYLGGVTEKGCGWDGMRWCSLGLRKSPRFNIKRDGLAHELVVQD